MTLIKCMKIIITSNFLELYFGKISLIKNKTKMEEFKSKLINELLENGWNFEYIGGGYGQNLINDILESETFKSLLPVVSSTFKEKETLNFDEWLQEYKGFELDKTETYIEELSLNFNKYNIQYKKWLKNQP